MKIREDATEGRGGPQNGGNVLQGGGTDGALIWLGVFGIVNRIGENGGRDTHLFSETNHGEAVRRREDRMWFTPAAEEVQEATRTQSATTYIGHRHGMVAQWVTLRLIFDVYKR